MRPSTIMDGCLWLGAGVYLAAFASFLHQIPSLVGDQGLLPIANRINTECAASSSVSLVCYMQKEYPTLLEPDITLQMLCLLGILLSSLALILPFARDCVLFAALTILYHSIAQHGSTFTHFQWDSLLVETGVFLTLAAPCRLYRAVLRVDWLPADNVTLWLIRWLALRLMFASGVVKLTSECPTWWNLTALNFHFWSQCLPTWPAWFVSLSADWLKQLAVTVMFIVEIWLPATAFLAPSQHIRKLAFLAQVVLMLGIMVTGNYNWFNVNYILLCLPLLVDMKHSKIGSHQFVCLTGKTVYWLLSSMLIGAFYGLIGYSLIQYFGMRITVWNGLWNTQINTQIMFSKSDFVSVLVRGVPWLLLLAVGSLSLEILCALLRCVTDVTGVIRRMFALVSTLFVCIVACVAFAVTLVPFTHGLGVQGLGSQILPREVYSWYEVVDRLQLTHSYGLFRRMTGVGGRPEVVIEGSLNPQGPWRQFEFQYKPGALDRKPSIIIPHQPRLDWQMWFAALGNPNQNPWLLALAHRLLTNQRIVTSQLSHNPFWSSPPSYIRMQLYHYEFTTDSLGIILFLLCNFLRFEKKQMGEQKVYKAETGKSGKESAVSKWINELIRLIRVLCDRLTGEQFVWTVLGTALLTAYIPKLLFIY